MQRLRKGKSKCFHRVGILGLTLGLAMLFLALPIQASDGMLADLSGEQIAKLEPIIDDFYARQQKTINMLEVKYQALLMELQRPDAFADAKTAKASSENFKRLVRELGDLLGQLLRERTDYLLAIKDILTPEQKKGIVYSLDFDVEPEDHIRIYYDVDTDELLGGFTPEQAKKLLKIRHKFEVKTSKLELKIDTLAVEFREAYMQAEPDSKKIRKLLTKITELNIEMLNAAVDYSLATKDVLTDEQKQRLRHFYLTVFQSDILR